MFHQPHADDVIDQKFKGASSVTPSLPLHFHPPPPDITRKSTHCKRNGGPLESLGADDCVQPNRRCVAACPTFPTTCGRPAATNQSAPRRTVNQLGLSSKMAIYATEWTRRETEELIDLWEDIPLLWNASAKDYHNKECRQASIRRIANIFLVPGRW